jgi:EAL and modified HD-GYP domain-containing signal transduction protein
LQRWLQIMLYAEPSKRGHSMTPLLMLATTRGRLLELLAGKLRPSQRESPISLHGRHHVADGYAVRYFHDRDPGTDPGQRRRAQALLTRSGFGDLLKLVECIERIEEMDNHIVPTLRDLAMSTDDLVELEMAAFEWSDNVVRYAL